MKILIFDEAAFIETAQNKGMWVNFNEDLSIEQITIDNNACPAIPIVSYDGAESKSTTFKGATPSMVTQAVEKLTTVIELLEEFHTISNYFELEREKLLEF